MVVGRQVKILDLKCETLPLGIGKKLIGTDKCKTICADIVQPAFLAAFGTGDCDAAGIRDIYTWIFSTVVDLSSRIDSDRVCICLL